MREITASIQGGNSEVLNQHRLTGGTAIKRRRIAEEQHPNPAGKTVDIYDEDVDFNFVKIHLLSYFGDHIRGFGNIQKYSTEAEEISHKSMIKEDYRESNNNAVSHQILGTSARLESFKIHEMNIQTDLRCPIEAKLRDKQHTRQVSLVTQQPQQFTPTVETFPNSILH